MAKQMISFKVTMCIQGHGVHPLLELAKNQDFRGSERELFVCSSLKPLTECGE